MTPTVIATQTLKVIFLFIWSSKTSLDYVPNWNWTEQAEAGDKEGEPPNYTPSKLKNSAV